jgi:exo-1,4-beta-D-glucosaminidase
MELRWKNGWVVLWMVGLNGLLYAAGIHDGPSSKTSKIPYQCREKENKLVLRSTDYHGGQYPWQIIKNSNEFLNGKIVSDPDFSSKDAMEAIVPGTVLNTLVHNAVYPEPYYGLNNANEKKLIPDLKDAGQDFYTYWFRSEFELSPAFQGKQVMMRFDGINYRAEIWLNGQKIGSMAGMFNRGIYNITQAAKFKGKNALAVLVKPVDVPGGFRNKFKQARAVGENKNGGDGKIGKNVTMLMSVGWDFTFSDGIRDRNTGIWKDVVIYAVDAIELRDPFVKSDLSMPDMKSCQQDITVEAINQTDMPQTGVIKAVIDGMDVAIEKKVELAPNEIKKVHFSPEEYKELRYKNPKLWWPINKGPQNLYELRLTVEKDGCVTDRQSVRFAVRHVSSDCNTPDKSRQFYINGRPIFLHGTNWIPEAMLRKTEERMYAEMRYTQQAGINFIRFWAGGIAESDYFFDLCDELGIMVSMEFWLTGDTDLPEDFDLYRANLADTVKTIRNHPSLIYYISANERGRDNIVPVQDLIEKLDGTRGYQAASEIDGIHDGSPYSYVNPMFYYDDSASDRGSRINGLCPEYGTTCLPTLDCLEEMMDKKDIWPVNKTVWDYHDGGGFHDMASKYVRAMEQYGSIESAEELAWKGQMVGATAYRSIWECWTYNRLNNGDRYTSGVWFWYHNSPIRQVCGRMWDWSLEPTAALYYSQDAHEPIHAQYDFIKNTVSVNNEYYKPFEGAVSLRIFNLDMTLKHEQKVSVRVGSDTIANDVIKVKLPTDLSDVHFIRLDVYDTRGNLIADTFYWRSNDDYQGKKTYSGPLYSGFQDIEKLKTVTLLTKAKKDGDTYIIMLKNPSDALAFMIRVKLADPKSAKPIRPAFYTDNFFSLLPGEEKTVKIEPYRVPDSASIIMDGWNVKKTNHTNL